MATGGRGASPRGGRSGGGGFGGGGPVEVRSKGVFVSHASEDAPLSQAFCDLIQDVSAGLIPTYSSSSKDQAAGIPYGDDWFDWIEERIRDSGNVVALITPTSVGRPWILFEAGFGKAIEGAKVFGLRLGATGEESYVGPFKRLMNSGSELDDLLKLCRQLFEGTACQPRDEMIREQITKFRKRVEEFFKTAAAAPKKSDPQSEAFFNALEEMKSLVQSGRSGYAEEWDEMRMMELDHIAHFVMAGPRKEITPALRLTLLLGLASEVGLGWIVPTFQYALEAPMDLKMLERMLKESEFGMMRRHRRMMPFPPGMLIHELLRAVHDHQRMKFRRLKALDIRDIPEGDEPDP